MLLRRVLAHGQAPGDGLGGELVAETGFIEVQDTYVRDIVPLSQATR